MPSNFVNSSVLGVNLQGNSDGATALFGLGQHVLGNASTEWIYVNAGLAITTGQIVGINAAFTATPATATVAFAGQQLAFAQGAFAASDYGWVALRGDNLVVALSGVSTLGAALYIGNSGQITTTAASGTLAGVTILTASATAILNAATTAYVSWPRLSAGALFGV